MSMSRRQSTRLPSAPPTPGRASRRSLSQPPVPARPRAIQEFIDQHLAQDPIFSNAEKKKSLENKISQKIQPWQHCQSDLFPSVALKYGLKRYVPVQSLPLGKKAVVCHINGKKQKEDCHDQSLPAFLYSIPSTECIKAKSRSFDTLLWRYTLKYNDDLNITELFGMQCWACWTKGYSGCSLLSLHLTPENTAGLGEADDQLGHLNPRSPPLPTALVDDSAYRTRSAASAPPPSDNIIPIVPDDAVITTSSARTASEAGLTEESRAKIPRSISAAPVPSNFASDGLVPLLRPSRAYQRDMQSRSASGGSDSADQFFASSIVAPTSISTVYPIGRNARRQASDTASSAISSIQSTPLPSELNATTIPASGGQQNGAAVELPVKPIAVPPLLESSDQIAPSTDHPVPSRAPGMDILLNLQNQLESFFSDELHSYRLELQRREGASKLAKEVLAKLIEQCQVYQNEAVYDRAAIDQVRQEKTTLAITLNAMDEKIIALSETIENMNKSHQNSLSDKDKAYSELENQIKFLNDKMENAQRQQSAVDMRYMEAVKKRKEAEAECARMGQLAAEAISSRNYAELAMNDAFSETDEERANGASLANEVEELKARIMELESMLDDDPVEPHFRKSSDLVITPIGIRDRNSFHTPTPSSAFPTKYRQDIIGTRGRVTPSRTPDVPPLPLNLPLLTPKAPLISLTPHRHTPKLPPMSNGATPGFYSLPHVPPHPNTPFSATSMVQPSTYSLTNADFVDSALSLGPSTTILSGLSEGDTHTTGLELPALQVHGVAKTPDNQEVLRIQPKTPAGIPHSSFTPNVL